MNTLTKKIVLPCLVMLLPACAIYPNHHNSYPGNGSYHSGYGNYQNHDHSSKQPNGYRGQEKPYGDHHSNNQNNNYNRPSTWGRGHDRDDH